MNEGDKAPTCYKHGTSIDFSSFGMIGNKTIENAEPRKCSVLLIREGTIQKKEQTQWNVISKNWKKIFENFWSDLSEIHKILFNVNLEEIYDKKNIGWNKKETSVAYEKFTRYSKGVIELKSTMETITSKVDSTENWIHNIMEKFRNSGRTQRERYRDKQIWLEEISTDIKK